MLRVLYFLVIIILPVIFSWWLFIPLALLYVYLAKLPYEIIVAAILLDSLYYFGDSFFSSHQLLIFSLILLTLALFFSAKIHWQKVI